MTTSAEAHARGPWKADIATIRHLLTLEDLRQHEVTSLVDRTLVIKGCRTPPASLRGRVVGTYFQRTSTRTRSAFTVGALRLGASVVPYGPNDLQTNTGETLSDTARVLGGYLDALVVRTASPLSELRVIAEQSGGRMAVVNAMAAEEHPTQALADLATMQEHFGMLDGLRVLYLGEGNNTATALMAALSRVRNTHLVLLTPDGYGVAHERLVRAQENASSLDSTVTEWHDPTRLPAAADVVYTTRWQTTGTSKPDANWRTHFAPFKVTASLMKRIATSGTVLMHDLPAVRGEDVDAEVLDGPSSIAFAQAHNKLFGAMAALEWCLCVPASNER